MTNRSRWAAAFAWGGFAFSVGALAGAFAVIAMALWGEDL